MPSAQSIRLCLVEVQTGDSFKMFKQGDMCCIKTKLTMANKRLEPVKWKAALFLYRKSNIKKVHGHGSPATWPAVANRETLLVVKLYCHVVNFHKQQRIYEPELVRNGRRGRGKAGEVSQTGAILQREPWTQSSTVISLHRQPAPSRILIAHIPQLVFTQRCNTLHYMLPNIDHSAALRAVYSGCHGLLNKNRRPKDILIIFNRYLFTQ